MTNKSSRMFKTGVALKIRACTSVADVCLLSRRLKFRGHLHSCVSCWTQQTAVLQMHQSGIQRSAGHYPSGWRWRRWNSHPEPPRRGHPSRPHTGTGRHCCKRWYGGRAFVVSTMKAVREVQVKSTWKSLRQKWCKFFSWWFWGSSSVNNSTGLEIQCKYMQLYLYFWRSWGCRVKGSRKVDSEVPANVTRLNTWLWLLTCGRSFNWGLQACKTENVHVGCDQGKVYLVHTRHSFVKQNDLTLRGVNPFVQLILRTVQREDLQNLSPFSVLPF